HDSVLLRLLTGLALMHRRRRTECRRFGHPTMCRCGIATVLGIAGTQLAPVTTHAAGIPAYDHVFVIVMENHSYGQIIGSPSAPYINSLLSSGSLATNYYGVSHPSLPNYLALACGSTYGTTSDCTSCWVAAHNR